MSVQGLEARMMLAAIPFSEPQVLGSDADDVRSVFAGDLDGDGDLDVLSASFDDDTLRWFANDSAGGFSPANEITTAADGAHSVFGSDIDRDGDMDVLLASFYDNTIAWYANDGSGGFASEQIIDATAAGASSVFSADVDKDGDMDVLTASRNDDTIAWYANDGVGGFGPRQLIASDADEAVSVHGADMDGDGDLDVLSASFGNDTIAWYENDGTPSGAGDWSPHTISTSADGAYSVNVVDVDRDGDLDVVSASTNDDTIAWYANDGFGGFGQRQVISSSATGARSVYAMDLDRDGDADVLSASAGDDTIAIYENLGNGAFAVAKLISNVADGVSSVVAVDIDRDGDQDVLAALSGNDTVAWLKNESPHHAAGFAKQHIIAGQVYALRDIFAADLDGDGNQDILSASRFDDKIAWYENRLDGATGDFGPQQLINTPDPDSNPYNVRNGDADGAYSVFAVDLDGDGDEDVLSASHYDDKIAWYENRLDEGTGDFGPQQVITTSADGAYSVFAVDLDGDGDADVLSASFDDDKIAWYENRLDEPTSDFGPQQVITTSADGANSVFAADLDGDGHLDVLSASRRDDKIAWYENRLDEPAGDFGLEQVITTSADGVYSVFAADLDGDGHPDVLSASGNDDKIAWYENRLDEASADFGAQQVITTSTNLAASVFASDLDGDGDADVLSASGFDDKIAWYENRLNEPAGDFGPQQLITSGADRANSVLTADLDGDGDQEVLSGSSLDGKIAWYENRLDEPTNDFGPQHAIIIDAGDARSVFAVDLDVDGDQDVLSASSDDNKIAWYENRLGEAAGDFGPQQVITTIANGAWSVFASDVDGDGDPDVLSASSDDDKIAWYENRLDEVAGDFGPQQVITTSADQARTVFALDVDGDGDPDVLSASSDDDKIAWYENRLGEAAGDFGPQQVITTSADGANSVFASDLDGDGDSDVLSASSADDKIAWYENRLDEAEGDFGPQQVITTSADGAWSVFASDLDGDGDLDVASASIFDYKIAWYENRLDEAEGDFGPQQVISTSVFYPRSVFVSDVDGDGDLDVLSASDDNKIAWYSNRLDEAAGSFGPQQLITGSAYRPFSVFTSDVDGDGDPDVLSASWFDDKIAWYENTWGVIADMDLDRDVDLDDVDPFVLALTDPPGYERDYGLPGSFFGDVNQDGDLDLDDVDDFVAILTGTGSGGGQESKSSTADDSQAAAARGTGGAPHSTERDDARGSEATDSSQSRADECRATQPSDWGTWKSFTLSVAVSSTSDVEVPRAMWHRESTRGVSSVDVWAGGLRLEPNVELANRRAHDAVLRASEYTFAREPSHISRIFSEGSAASRIPPLSGATVFEDRVKDALYDQKVRDKFFADFHNPELSDETVEEPDFTRSQTRVRLKL